MDCRSRNALDMFAKSISKLERQLQANSIAQYITPYDGLDPKLCRPWIADVERWAHHSHADDDDKKNALFITAKRTVSDFIKRYLESNRECSWSALREAVLTHFACDCKDKNEGNAI